jgi:hypothetical protein
MMLHRAWVFLYLFELTKLDKQKNDASKLGLGMIFVLANDVMISQCTL